MRKFIRHPFDIPIEFEVLTSKIHDTPRLSNISYGGLCFQSTAPLKVGEEIKVRIDVTAPAFETQVQVVWCKDCETYFEIGTQLTDSDEAYRVRMVEQICYIEHYKRETWMKEGRHLTAEQAAQEWIERFAEDFPAIHEEHVEEDLATN